MLLLPLFLCGVSSGLGRGNGGEGRGDVTVGGEEEEKWVWGGFGRR